ncbi:MAG: phage head-tail connector protein [Wolbachia sp.]
MYNVNPNLNLFQLLWKKLNLNLRLENYQNDKLISSFISVATDYAEWYTEKSLVKQTWQVSYEDYILHRIYLSYGPVKMIMSVTVTMSKNQEKRTPRYYFSDVG